jgi:transcriptional regulator with XRE-family HTH domain
MESAFERILNRIPLHTKVSVSKAYDLAENLGRIMGEKGIEKEELADMTGLSVEEIESLLSGFNIIYDKIAKLEAALESDIFIAVNSKGYFNRDK